MKLNYHQKEFIKKIAKTLKISHKKALELCLQNLVDRYLNETYIDIDEILMYKEEE